MHNYKKASKFQKSILATVRLLGIRIGVLPKNFPKNIHLYTIREKKTDWAGLGGKIQRDKESHFFIAINLAFAYNLEYLLATLAHEILHVQQTRNDESTNHGNKFRHDCAEFSKIIGASYYLVYGYDAPSAKVAKSKAKKHELWLLSFGEDSRKRKAKDFNSTEIDLPE